MLTQYLGFVPYTGIAEAIACCACRNQSLVWGTRPAPYNRANPGWDVSGLLAQKEHVCGWKERGKKPVCLFCSDLILLAQRFYITPSVSWEEIINYDYYYSLVVTCEYYFFFFEVDELLSSYLFLNYNSPVGRGTN